MQHGVPVLDRDKWLLEKAPMIVMIMHSSLTVRREASPSWVNEVILHRFGGGESYKESPSCLFEASCHGS